MIYLIRQQSFLFAYLLSFRLFEYFIFYASKNLKEMETVMNEEFQNILKYCNANK
jgi:hypothetical protein